MSYNQYKKKTGLNVNQLFTNKISDNYGATRVSSSKNRLGTDYVVIHTTANTATAKQEAQNIANNKGIVSFHAVADEFGVYETVKFSNVAHHAGNKQANRLSLGFELSEKNIEKGYENLIKYVGWVMYQLGLQPNKNHIKLHSEFVSTSCGTYYKKKGLDNVIKDIKHYYDVAKGENKPVSKPKPVPKPKPTKKTVKIGGNMRLFKVSRKDDTYPHGKNVKTNVRKRTLDILDEDNGRVKVRIKGFNPEVLWLANSEVTRVGGNTTSNDRYINIKPNKKGYGLYALNVQPVAKNIGTYVNPGSSGLSYKIRRNTKYSNVYVIRTRDYGERQIYLDKSRASITSKPSYKVYG